MLRELVGDSPVVTIIGLSKNAGKTTAMRQLVGELFDERLALTSVGRDGESTDLVTGTEKPSLYVKEGDLFATARGMLALCDTTCSVEAMTGVVTPLGEVAVFRALSDGFVQLAGPSSAGQLPKLNDLFVELGAQRILIDGAAGRRSLASAGVSGCTLLCVGAAFDVDMDVVVEETAHICSLFALNKTEVDLSSVEGERFALFGEDGGRIPLAVTETGVPSWKDLPQYPCVLWVGGAVTDTTLKALSQHKEPVTVVVEDCTHILAGRASVDAFYRNGGELQVRQALRLAGVCANPTAPGGWNFPPCVFLERLRAAVSLPVIDVKGGC